MFKELSRIVILILMCTFITACQNENKEQTKEKIKSILNNAQFSNSIFIDELQKKYNDLLQDETAEKRDFLNTFE